MEFYSEEEKMICRVKIESEGKEILSQKGCLSTREINEIADNFYKDLISSPKSVFSVPFSILSKSGTPMLVSIIFMDVLEKNRYEIWFVDKSNLKTHPWKCGGTLIECSKEFDSIADAMSAATDKLRQIAEQPN